MSQEFSPYEFINNPPTQPGDVIFSDPVIVEIAQLDHKPAGLAEMHAKNLGRAAYFDMYPYVMGEKGQALGFRRLVEPLKQSFSPTLEESFIKGFEEAMSIPAKVGALLMPSQDEK